MWQLRENCAEVYVQANVRERRQISPLARRRLNVLPHLLPMHAHNGLHIAQLAP